MILVPVAIGLIWALIQFALINSVKLISAGEEQSLVDSHTQKLKEIYEAIKNGADAFLNAEYTICLIFVVIFGFVIFLLISIGQGSWLQGMFTAISFVLGAFTSILSGWIGMKVAVHSNVRTTIGAQKGGYMSAFNVAFRAGSVMGFTLTSMAILVLYFTLSLYRLHFTDSDWEIMMDCVSGCYIFFLACDFIYQITLYT